jgi:hypothetical protein
MYEKTRVVIELSDEDYKILSAIKNFSNLNWRDLLIAGALYVIDELKLEEKLDNLLNTIETLRKIKQSLN